ncbi:PREDICTED: actin-related protein 2/3 complex subunit 2B-like isoform X2 [Populus euphratica]|uniref:Arp2/3 complex 34 kDa subunit n=1 Tax=Populus euphratica TaxID=75702 RepID=A0AAJ6UHT5_POPEU|nr:PREDICTED: actin-related protein 2/3 complex subunit 2B-like isoform X2 [Populus euphratica]
MIVRFQLAFYSKFIDIDKTFVFEVLYLSSFPPPCEFKLDRGFFGMACFERVSPALKEILLKLYRAEKPVEIDHHLYEFGCVEYHVQGALLSCGLSSYTTRMVQQVCSDAVEIVEHAKEGYQLTLKLNLAKIPRGKDSYKVITQISSVQAVILCSQLKEMLRNVNSQDTSQGMNKPIKLVYHPREPFYVIRQPQKITAVFPMRFKEHSDVIIATASFQELMDLGSSEKWAKAPPCTWSPIPPPELRGEPLEDLSTNGGFVSFDISSRHVEGKKLDKTVWSLLNFYAYVKKHVKGTRGFIQRRMQKRLESLVEVLHKEKLEENEDVKKFKAHAECRYVGKLVGLSKPKNFKRRCRDLTRKILQIRFRIKIHGFRRFHRRWLIIPKFSSPLRYTKLE